MEMNSAVARDNTCRPSRSCLTFCVAAFLLSIAVSTCGAEPPASRSGKGGSRPSRPSRFNSDQNQGQRLSSIDELEDGAVQLTTGTRTGTTIEQAAETAADDAQGQLPKNIHPQHPLVPALQLAYKSRTTLQEVTDYTAVFVKKELIGQNYITHTMDMKFREKPFGVYLRFKDPNEGRQVLYPGGPSRDQLLVQEPGLKGGLLGTIALDPKAPLAMSENRHPITEIGISNMLNRIIQQWEAEGEFGEIDVKYFPDAKLGNHPVKVIATTHPIKRNQFKYHRTFLYLDGTTLFPVRVEQYDWPGQQGGKPVQVELYMYSSVRTNVGLNNRDFDPRNYNMR